MSLIYQFGPDAAVSAIAAPIPGRRRNQPEQQMYISRIDFPSYSVVWSFRIASYRYTVAQFFLGNGFKRSDYDILP